jgi:hypothetical protein
MLSKWKAAAVLTGLSSLGLLAGLVYSQQSAPRPASAGVDPNMIVKIREGDGPELECIILSSTRQSDGRMAHQVRVLSTGQTMTYYEPASTDSGKNVVWNKGQAVPVGQAVHEHVVNNPSRTAGKMETVGADEFRMLQEAGKPALKCRVMYKWRNPEGRLAMQMQSVDTGEIITVAEATVPQGAPESPAGGVAMRIYHWGRNTTPPLGVPVPPLQETVIATSQPMTGPSYPASDSLPPGTVIEQSKPRLGERIKDAISNLVPSRNSTTQVVQAPAISYPVTPAPFANDYKTTDSQKLVASGPATMTPPGKPAIDPVFLPPVPKEVKENTVQSVQPPVAPVAKTPSVPAVASLPPAKLVMTDAKPAPAQDYAKSSPMLPPLPSSAVKPSLPAGSTLPSSRQADKDPLTSPERFNPAAKDLADKSPSMEPGSAMAGDAKMPPGSGSVWAAANGGNPPFVPVPIVTVPQAKPPSPPPPQMPKPPEDGPNPTWYVNAFTPPLPPNAVSEQAMMAQAMQQQRQMQMMQMQMQAAMMQQGYPMAAGYPMMAGGYPMAMVPMQYAPAPMPLGRGNVPMAYQGPMPPSPMPQTMPASAGYQMPMMMMPMMPAQPAGYGNPVMDRPGGIPTGLSPTNMQQNINTLQSSLYPSQREMAVINLCEGEYRGHPQVVQLLLKVARDDPAPTVRAACVMGLARLNVNSEAMKQTLTALKTDADPRVRVAVDEALSRLAPSSGVVTTGGRQ